MKSLFNGLATASLFTGAIGVVAWGVGMSGEFLSAATGAQNALAALEVTTSLGALTSLVSMPGVIYHDIMN